MLWQRIKLMNDWGVLKVSLLSRMLLFIVQLPLNRMLFIWPLKQVLFMQGKTIRRSRQNIF